jgi:hypothetical protein
MLDDKTLENLRLESELIQKNFDFWQKNIEEKGARLNFLLNRDNTEDEEEISKLTDEINLWQHRGQKEQKILEQYQHKSSQILWGSMLSGLNQIQ